jgi:hypothetical protein
MRGHRSRSSLCIGSPEPGTIQTLLNGPLSSGDHPTRENVRRGIREAQNSFVRASRRLLDAVPLRLSSRHHSTRLPSAKRPGNRYEVEQ